jgi:hypothetical protein
VEFTRGSSAAATIDQMDYAYYETVGDPFVAAGIVCSTSSPLAPTVGAVVPTTIGSLATQWI